MSKTLNYIKTKQIKPTGSINFPILILLLIFLTFHNLMANDPGILIVKGDYNYPPYEYLNEHNQPEGFNVDIITAIADVMNLNIAITLGPWHEVRREIETGKIDVLMGMYETEERHKLVDFTVPHLITSYAVFVPKRSKIKAIEDINGKKILVQQGDLGHDYVIEHQLSDNIMTEHTPDEVLYKLSENGADCALLPRLQGMMIIKDNQLKNIKVVGAPIIQRHYCMAVTEGDAALLAQLNEGLNIIKTSGRYDEIYTKWFGVYTHSGLSMKTILRWLALIVIPLLAIIIFIFLWNWSLKKQVDQRTEELRKSREDLQITLNSIGDGVISTDIHGNILRLNPVAEQLTGWPLEEAAGKPLPDHFKIVNAKTGQPAENPVEKVLDTGKIVAMANDTVLISKNGARYQIADSAAPIKNLKNEIVGVVLVFRDVSREYKTLEKLRQSELNLRTVFEAADTIAFIKTEVNGEKSKILDFSPGAERIFGYKAAEIIGQPIAALHTDSDIKKLQNTLHPDNHNEIGFNTETQLIRKDQTRFPALFTTHHIFDNDGKMANAITVAVDMTEQKKIEAELIKIQNIKSLGNLAGGIAHDFNNILTGIYGNVSLAKMHLSQNHKAYGLLTEAEKSMDRATKLTRQLLTFSKGGSPQKEMLEIPGIAKEVIAFDLSGSNVKLRMDIAENLWPVAADKSQMGQVFSNLAINANQAMPEGGHIDLKMENIKVANDTIAGLAAGNYVKIEFKDGGTGIAEKDIHQVFNPYFTTKSTGSGLGLSTVFSIIKKHHGHITVNSIPGTGTTFTFYLPASTKSEISESAEPSGSNRQAQKKAKILVMDDEEMICNLATSMLSQMGHETVTAHDGEETLKKFTQAQNDKQPFDLVILDLTIPGGMGGKETCRELLKINPQAKVLVSSGYTQGKIMSSYADYGFQGLIEKPYSFSKMKSVVNQFINN